MQLLFTSLTFGGIASGDIQLLISAMTAREGISKLLSFDHNVSYIHHSVMNCLVEGCNRRFVY
jgi:hypothetical protein